MSFIRASRKASCPVCGAKKWPCSQTSDGRVAFCQNVYSERRSSDGQTYVHFLFDLPAGYKPPVIVPEKVEPKRAGADRLHEVFSALLGRLSLRPHHHNELLTRRGLPLKEIAARGYKSTPTAEEGQGIVRELVALGLDGVPGFFKQRFEGVGCNAGCFDDAVEQWSMVKCLPGYFIPYRDASSRIRGLAYRLDTPMDKTKFIWLSSNPEKEKYKNGGTPSGAPLHFARPHLLARSKEVWLTEGALKADIASFYLRKPFIAAAGVTNWGKNFAPAFREKFPDKQIVVAYDMDWQSNKDVRAALERLMDSLSDERIPFIIRTWGDNCKGIDDLCLYQNQMEVAA